MRVQHGCTERESATVARTSGISALTDGRLGNKRGEDLRLTLGSGRARADARGLSSAASRSDGGCTCVCAGAHGLRSYLPPRALLAPSCAMPDGLMTVASPGGAVIGSAWVDAPHPMSFATCHSRTRHGREGECNGRRGHKKAPISSKRQPVPLEDPVATAQAARGEPSIAQREAGGL